MPNEDSCIYLNMQANDWVQILRDSYYYWPSFNTKMRSLPYIFRKLFQFLWVIYTHTPKINISSNIFIYFNKTIKFYYTIYYCYNTIYLYTYTTYSSNTKSNTTNTPATTPTMPLTFTRPFSTHWPI